MQICRWKSKCNFIFHSFLNITKTWSKNPARTPTTENTKSVDVVTFLRKMNEEEEVDYQKERLTSDDEKWKVIGLVHKQKIPHTEKV